MAIYAYSMCNRGIPRFFWYLYSYTILLLNTDVHHFLCVVNVIRDFSHILYTCIILSYETYIGIGITN